VFFLFKNHRFVTAFYTLCAENVESEIRLFRVLRLLFRGATPLACISLPVSPEKASREMPALAPVRSQSIF